VNRYAALSNAKVARDSYLSRATLFVTKPIGAQSGMHSGGSVLEAPPGAEEGALPR